MKKHIIIMLTIAIAACSDNGGGAESSSTNGNEDSASENSQSDSRLMIEPPIEHQIAYTGPTETSANFKVGYREYENDEIVSDENVWVPCGDSWDTYIHKDGESCSALGNSLISSWDTLPIDINSGFVFPDVISREASYELVEQRDAGSPRNYGEFKVRISLKELPSTLNSSQSSVIYTLRHSWINFPAYLNVETATENTDAYICTRLNITATEVDNNSHPQSETVTVTDESFCNSDMYVFSPPPDSELWPLNEPVQYVMLVEQIITKSNLVE